MAWRKMYENWNDLTNSRYVKFAAILLAIFLFGASMWDRLARDTGTGNLYAHQAQSFLEGRLDIPERLYDCAEFQDRYYLPFPPFPAVVLMPFVAALGVENTRVMWISLLISLVVGLVLLRILQKIAVPEAIIPWLMAAFLFGTGFWYVLQHSSGVWFFAHIVAVACSFMAIYAALVKDRAAVAGLWMSFAFLSRQSTLYLALFLAAVLWRAPSRASTRSRLGGVLAFFSIMGLGVAAYLAFNTLRFGNPFDTGYAYLACPGFLQERVDRFGLFHPAYFAYNFSYMFLQGFHITFKPPAFVNIDGMDLSGTSLTFASPFIFIALKSSWDKKTLIAAWGSIGLVLAQILFYYNNGWAQVNTQRFSLDFLPVLILLVALGAKNVDRRILKLTVSYSIFLNIVAVVIIPAINRILG